MDGTLAGFVDAPSDCSDARQPTSPDELEARWQFLLKRIRHVLSRPSPHVATEVHKPPSLS
jgi:hypothetical protein